MFEKLKIKLKGNERAIVICLIIWIAMLLTFVLSLIISNGYAFKSLFFRRTEDIIMDFSNSIRDSRGNNVYSYYHSIYPPTAVLFFRFLSLFYKPEILNDPNKYIMWKQPLLYIQFSLFVIACYLIVFIALRIKLKGYSKITFWFVFLFIVLSFPFIYAIERGNIILLSAALIIFFVCCYKNNNRLIHELSLFALALSISTKLYPVIFAVILIKNKDIIGLTKAGIYSVLMIFLPFCFYSGLEGLDMLMFKPFSYFSKSISSNNSNLRLILYHLDLISGDGFIFKYFNYLVIIWFVILAFYSKKEYITTLCICIAMLHFPGAEGTYTQAFMLPAFALILSEEKLDMLDFVCLIWFILQYSLIGLFNDKFSSYMRYRLDILMYPAIYIITIMLVFIKNKRPFCKEGLEEIKTPNE